VWKGVWGVSDEPKVPDIPKDIWGAHEIREKFKPKPSIPTVKFEPKINKEYWTPEREL